MCALHAGQFDGGQGPRDCLYRCSTSTGTSRTTWRATTTCPLCPREKTYQGTAASVAAHQREVCSGGGNSLLEKFGRPLQKTRRSNRYGVCYTSTATFIQTSAGTRVGTIEHPQKPYPRILMDWVASPLRETQPRPRPLQRKVQTKTNSLHRADFCRGE